MRSLVCLCIAFTGCISSGGGGGGGSGGQDGGVKTHDGAVDERTPPAAGYIDDSATVERILRELVDLGCGRFHGDCNYLCDQPLYVCGPTRAKCTDDFVRSALDDFTHPFVDPGLVARYAQDVRDAACVDVPPDTVACEQVVVEGCAGDEDALGTPYSWLSATEVAPGEIRIFLCDDVEEWLAIDLEADQSVTVTGAGDGPNIGHVSVELYVAPASSDEEPFSLLSRSVSWEEGQPAVLGPVDGAGRYFVRFELSGQPDTDVRFTLEVGAPEVEE